MRQPARSKVSLHVHKHKKTAVHGYVVEKHAGLFLWTWLDIPIWAGLIYLWLKPEFQASVSLRYGLISLLCLLWLAVRYMSVRKESLLVLAKLGMQLSSQVELRLPGITLPVQGQTTVFIPAASIRDILLVEGLNGWSVIWYMAIVADEGEGVKLYIPFRTILPRLPLLKSVWKGSRSVFFSRDVKDDALR